MNGRVGIVGARQRRRGTGPYLAREFHAAGCRVAGFVGTRPATIREAESHLRRTYGIATTGFLSIPDLIRSERIDILAICSPHDLHLEHLADAVEHGVHVLCEKPLWWREGIGEEEVRRQTEAIGHAFDVTRRLLAVNTQWPWTLGAFDTLYPGERTGAPRTVRMELAPSSRGVQMVIDSAPHILSLLTAVAGPGDVTNPSVSLQEEEGRLTFQWDHQEGTTEAELVLRRVEPPPRPAAYEIDGLRMERRIRLPEYRFQFEGGGRTIGFPDPLRLRVRDFLRGVAEGRRTPIASIVQQMVGLHRLVTASTAAQRGEGE